MQDGILTTAGVLCGLAGALPRRYEVILTALASTAAGAISMGAGAYLGTRAEGEVLEGELNRARGEVVHEPYMVQENLLDQLAKEGLSREAGYRVVKLLSSAPEALTKTAEQKVYGIGDNLVSNPISRRRRHGDGIRGRGAGAAVALRHGVVDQHRAYRGRGRDRRRPCSGSVISRAGSLTAPDG